MHKTIILTLALLVNLLPACKKDKAGEGPDSKEAKVSTVELSYTPSTSVYGSDLVFKIKFEDIGKGEKAITEYGIMYTAWITNLSDKTPSNGTGTAILFRDTPAAEKVIEKAVTLSFQQFNDANYRAFARLKDGTYVYGEVKYFVVA
ncbi:hypothetical protein [Agriterribacter sp.]|uniref:hypothetical protein n=1 Tax=Agriterribacter sp. TaxID=2821509 RepID=UPI002C7DFE59|nr:hypothetical protein [Agriterribacter sp.]HRP56790.1 hypothetical protein [Agriterribacter sp.]